MSNQQQWPTELTDELSDILGRPCFTFISLCQAYRAAGVDIPQKAEAEQAFFLHKMLTFWFEHGSNWRAKMGDEIEIIIAKARAAAAA